MGDGFAGSVESIATTAALAFELAGVLLLVALTLAAVVAALLGLAQRKPVDQLFEQFRTSLIRALLIGLEMLVVADIITTVIVDLTVPGLLALGLLIVIRTFLSLSLELEMKGTWPWARTRTRPASRDGRPLVGG